MNLIERVKKIITTPKTEWLIIATETTTSQNLLISYVLPLSIIYCLGNLVVGMFWSGIFGFEYFIIAAIISFISSIISFYVGAYAVELLAPNFESEKNINRSAQLIGYANTAIWLSGLFSFIPLLGLLLLIAGGVYSIYLMYLGIGPLKKTPDDKKIVYMIVVFVAMLVAGGIINYLLRMIIFRAMGYATF